VGKLLNQCFREEILIPEYFANPLLLYFLFDGEDGLNYLTVDQLVDAITDFDNGYSGSITDIDYLKVSYGNDDHRDNLLAFIHENIYSNRMDALNLMKKGFDLVPISKLLLAFNLDEFKKNFISKQIFDTDTFMNCIVCGEFDMDRPGEIAQYDKDLPFARMVLDCLRSLDFLTRRELLMFATSSHLILKGKTQIIITMKLMSPMSLVSTKVSRAENRFPSPMTSHTCYKQLFVPYISERTSYKDIQSSDSVSQLWTAENIKKIMTDNLKDGIGGAFHDNV